MDDTQFRTELWIRGYIDQIDGYPFGHPARKDFKPVIIVMGAPGGKIDRVKTLELPGWGSFTVEQKELLLSEAGWPSG
jgi:hypothetical protein